jgi:D-serine deaminase-like pyridoxal phosphate-dependent protein
MDSLYAIADTSRLLSPSLLVYRELVRENLGRMITMAGGPQRLRPHVKTHKMAAVVRMAAELGILKHKCATIAEAEMVAAAGGADVLLAYPLIGPNLKRWARLLRAYPRTTFRAIVDSPTGAQALSDSLQAADRPVPVLVDLDVGMGRTGIQPGEPAASLYALVHRLPHLEADGLHAYDGHINQEDLGVRGASARGVQEKTLALRDQLLREGLPVPRVVLGGTPSFPIHAALEIPGLECSPGTIVLHDHGYATRYPDLEFTPAALVLTRVISHPRPGRFCLDVGHKAVAADPTGPRVHLLGVPDVQFAGHSEEHLVVDSPAADGYPEGTCLLAIPTHICPTSALHRKAYVISGRQLVDEWEVTARDRVIQV